MNVPEFVLGVLATLAIEFIVVVIYALATRDKDEK